jgi:hypothetical protein
LELAGLPNAVALSPLTVAERANPRQRLIG